MENKLLLKAIWNNQDIMNYTGCAEVKASQIRQEAIKKYGGMIRMLPKMVYRDSVLKALKIDLNHEIEVVQQTIQLMEKEEKLQALLKPYTEQNKGE